MAASARTKARKRRKRSKARRRPTVDELRAEVIGMLERTLLDIDVLKPLVAAGDPLATLQAQRLVAIFQEHNVAPLLEACRDARRRALGGRVAGMAKVCPTCKGLVREAIERDLDADDLGEHWCDCAQVDARATLEDDEPSIDGVTPVSVVEVSVERETPRVQSVRVGAWGSSDE